MIYTFYAYGHPNITATHKTTLEFTKDVELSSRGNCIIGIKADFDLKEIKKHIRKSKNKRVTIRIANDSVQEKIIAYSNAEFSDEKELVIRKTDFISQRTFATKSDKAAFDLDRDLVNFLKERKNKIIISIYF